MKRKKMTEVKRLSRGKVAKVRTDPSAPGLIETPEDEKDPHYSSNIKAVAYFPDEKRLEVIFKAKDNPEFGRLYSFTQPKDITQPNGVPPSIWNNITAIYETFGSVGSFIAREVVQKYVGVRLDKGSV